MAGRINHLGGVILIGMGAWLGYNALTSKSLEHSAEAVRSSRWECGKCGADFDEEEEAEECCPCQHKNWEWIDVGGDLSYAEVECLDCEARGMHSLSIIEGWDAESFSAEYQPTEGYEDCEVCFKTCCIKEEPLHDVQAGRICDDCHSKNKYAYGTGRENNPPFNAEDDALPEHIKRELREKHGITKKEVSLIKRLRQPPLTQRGSPRKPMHYQDYDRWSRTPAGWVGEADSGEYTATMCDSCEAIYPQKMEGHECECKGMIRNLYEYDDGSADFDAESHSADSDAKGYYEPYAFCEFCSDEIQKEGDAVTLRGEIICKDCKEAWDEQPDDGGFWAEDEDSKWSEEDFRGAVSEIAWGDMTDRKPFEDDETLDQLHRYSQQAYGFEELSTLLRRQIYEAGEPCYCNDNDPDFMCYTCEVLEIIDNKDYEAEGHKMMADNFMPPSMLWNEEDDDADEDAVTYFAESLINEEFLAEYMADPSGSGTSRFMKESEVIDLFKKANGTLVSVTFVKRTNGEVRKMLARTSVKKGVKGVGLKFNPKNKKLIGVYDFQKVREGADPWKCYRFVPIDAVLSMRVRGKTYTA